MSRIEKYVVIYDISDTKARTKLSRLLFEYGIRTQLSVFEFTVKEKDYKKLIRLLKKRAEHWNDKIYVYPIDGKNILKIRRLGQMRNSIINDFFI